jgi:hypothetical protein
VGDYSKNEKGKLSPEQLAEMLAKNGIQISADQASSILKLLRMLADIVVTDYLKK